MFEKFTDRARRVIVFAQEESRLLNHNYIGTEHLLLGVLREVGGIGARALRALGVSLEDARNEVGSIVDAGQSPPAGHIPFTPRAKKVLELTLRESLQLGHNFIGTEHVLLGLIREGEGVGAQVLVNLGVGLQQTRAAVMEVLSGGSSEEIQESWDEVSDTLAEGSFTQGVHAISRSIRFEGHAATGGQVSGPVCLGCGSELTGSGASKIVNFADPDGTARSFLVLYCDACGATLEIRPEA